MLESASRRFVVFLLVFAFAGALVSCDSGGSLESEEPVEGKIGVSSDSLSLKVAADAQRSDTSEFTVTFDTLETGPKVEASGSLTAEKKRESEGEVTYLVFYDGTVDKKVKESITVTGSVGDQDLSKSLAVTVAPGASRRIQQSLQGLSKSMKTLNGGGFSTALKDFLGLQNGEATTADWAGQLVTELESVVQVSNGKFDFQGTSGKYAWDPSNKTWSKEGSSSSVILEFPASKGASKNATFELSSYKDTELTIDGESVYFPTDGKTSLTVAGSEVFSLDLSGAKYTTDDGVDVPIPQSVDLTILTAPHTHTFKLTEKSSREFDFLFDLSNGNQLVAGLTTTAQLATDDYSQLEGTDVKTLSGEVRIGANLTVPYSVQVGELAGFDDPTEEQINNRIDATVKFKGKKVATLQYDKPSESIEVVYPDGTVVPATKVLEDFLNEMESVWSDYLEDDGSKVGSTWGFASVWDTMSKVFRP